MIICVLYCFKPPPPHTVESHSFSPDTKDKPIVKICIYIYDLTRIPPRSFLEFFMRMMTLGTSLIYKFQTEQSILPITLDLWIYIK